MTSIRGTTMQRLQRRSDLAVVSILLIAQSLFLCCDCFIPMKPQRSNGISSSTTFYNAATAAVTSDVDNRHHRISIDSTNTIETKNKWHRKLLRKIFSRRRYNNDDEHIQTISTSASVLPTSKPTTMMPSSKGTGNVLSPTLPVHDASPKPIQRIHRKKETNVSPNNNKSRGGLVHSVTRNVFQNIAAKQLNKLSSGGVENNVVQCFPSVSETNLWNLVRGYFHCDASIAIHDPIRFGSAIRFSSGILEVKRLRVNLWRFCRRRNQLRTTARPRYLQQFDFLAHNVTMSQEDLYQSSCIRNGLIQLLTRILTNRGLSPKEISIESISILPCDNHTGGKISVRGKAIPMLSFVPESSSPEISFEVRSRIGTASRGHVVTFPGLEISLSPNTGFFVPIVPEITVDLGNNAQLLSIAIDPIKRQIQLDAKITITPDHTTILNKIPYQQSTQSYAAMCSIDVGRWITQIGQFAK